MCVAVWKKRNNKKTKKHGDFQKLYEDNLQYFRTRYGITFSVPSFKEWLRFASLHNATATRFCTGVALRKCVSLFSIKGRTICTYNS